MGYRLNRLDEPVFMAVPKPMLTEFGINYRCWRKIEAYLPLLFMTKEAAAAAGIKVEAKKTSSSTNFSSVYI